MLSLMVQDSHKAQLPHPTRIGIGRTGRAGKNGLATAFFADKDSGLAESLADLLQVG